MDTVAAARDQRDTLNRHRHRVFAIFVFLAAIVVATIVSGQDKNQKKKPEDPKLKPRPVVLKTKDGVKIRAFYFPTDKAKDAVTVLLVHEWQGQASPYGPLVLALRDAGCAVLAPDYRGHGGSTEYTNYRGKTETFNIAQMSKRDVENIIMYDLEKAKGFLKEENNAGNLNLNALVLIGIREGCVMAAHWAARDWSFPSVGQIKQGQDVKALVFISPEKQIKSVGIDPTLANPAILNLPIMIVAGAKSPEAAEANRIGKRVESVKKRVGGGTVSGFELKMLETTLSGPSLVNDVSDVIPAIVKFVTAQVPIAENANPWVERE